MQEFDCWVEHIARRLNVLADGFSRLLKRVGKNESVDEEVDSDTEELYVRFEAALPHDAESHIAKVHNELAGHGGVERTLECLRKLDKKWKYMREHVKQFIKLCSFCQKMCYLKVPIHTHPFTTAAYSAMERLGIDTIGP